MTFTIDPTICTNCGICTVECPAKTIRKEKEAARILPAGCIECSHCGMVCPVNAVRTDGKELPGYPENSSALTAREAHEHLIKSKRSVRHYTGAPVPKEDMDAIINAGESSATATNSQYCGAIVLEGDAVAEGAVRVAKMLLKFVRIGQHPAGRFLLRAAGMGRYAKKEMITGFYRLLLKTVEGSADPLFFHAPAVVILTYPARRGKRFGRTDCAVAGENMMLLAHGRNIESCMIGFAEAALFSKKSRKEFGIPPDRKIGLIFTLGYSDRKFYRYPARKPWTRGAE